MKVKLLKDSRREGKAGEIVEVSPERFAHLFSIEAAEAVTDAGEQAEEPVKAEKPEAKAPAKKTTKSSAKK